MASRPLHFCTLILIAVGVQATAQNAVSVAQILSENPDPFAQTDMAEVLAAYGPDGSGIDVSLGGISLQLGGIPLQIASDALVSDVTSIDGATGIFSDPSGFGFTVGLSGDYLFAFDKFDLTPDARAALVEVLALYEEYDGTMIEIDGHTDAKGSDDYNQRLSEQRAEAVANWFLETGISADLIVATGFGKTKPVAENTLDGQDNPDGRALNRRVDIRVTTQKRVNFVPLNTENTENTASQ